MKIISFKKFDQALPEVDPFSDLDALLFSDKKGNSAAAGGGDVDMLNKNNSQKIM